MSRDSSYSEHDQTPEFWFNVKTHLVEVGPQSSARNRIGPFSTREEAERALEIVGERARQIASQDADDDPWND